MRYNALASVYDRIMSHVEYDEWISLIDKISRKYLTKNNFSILELGGGTGILAEKLVKSGYSYQGSDFSYSMSREAKKRSISFVCADARNIPFKKRYDCIIFLYDGINYLRSIAEYKQLFKEVATCLNDGGIFLFDITTESNSMKHFYDYLDFEDYGDCSIVRHSYYDEISTTQFNDFTIFHLDKNNNSSYLKYKEHHEQKVFPPQIIEEAISGKIFSIIGIWDEFTMRKYSTRSERIHFLLKRNRRHDTVLTC